MITGVTALVASFALWIFREDLGQEWFAILGYFLTPYMVFAALTWDVIWQRNSQKDPWFDVRPVYGNILRVAAVASLVAAIPHILAIGRRVGEIAIEQGWG